MTGQAIAGKKKTGAKTAATKAAPAKTAESSLPVRKTKRDAQDPSATGVAVASSDKARSRKAHSGGSRAGSVTAGSLVDEELARYRSMRDFNVTAEPSGGKAASGASGKDEELPFVIQKHAATRLHYDFRLGWNGVLKSWAVTKGPSYFPGDKRLAVQVEDHPMEYGGFEGIIPKGQYGGGTVMVWDRGTWKPHGDANEGLARGNLKFELHGKKLKGSWALIRMHARPEDKGKANWLLIKEHDRYEHAEGDVPVVESQPDSALTGRDLNAIANDHDRSWNSNKGSAITTTEDLRGSAPGAALADGSGGGASASATRENASTKPDHRSPKISAKSPVKKKPLDPDAIAKHPMANAVVKVPADAVRERMPAFVEPQLAGQVKSPPTGDGWVHELKLDGYRMQGHVVRSSGAPKATLLTRNGLDWTARMPGIAQRLAALPVEAAILDGEVVVLTPEGATSFAGLQAAFQEGKQQQLTYFVFDLLHLNGLNLRNEPLQVRKELLRALLDAATDHSATEDDTLRYSEDIPADGARMFAEACRMGAEGIVSKLRMGKYASGRSNAWLKIKCGRQQELVIGGYTLPSKGGNGIGALLLGYYEDGSLVYAGRTGTGFTQASAARLRKQLEALRAKDAPFARLPPAARRGAIWVKPSLVAEVSFATWTADNLVRQAAFKGLREDKPAADVRREQAIPVEAVAGEAERKSNVSRKAAVEPETDMPERGSRDVTGLRAAGLRALGVDASASILSQPAKYQVRLTHPDKQLDAESKLTKRELADYYSAVADAMLPHIANRPLSIVRCPQGSEKPCFFQKHIAEGLPEGIEGVMIAGNKGGEPENYITLSTGQGLAGLAQLGVLEIHPWGSSNDHLEQPDRLIFDLDPDATISWSTLVEAAMDVKARMKEIGLESFVKLTGGKGLHVVAPIEPDKDWSAIKAVSRAFAEEMVAANPKLYLMKMTKAARKDKIYVDYLRNERGATAVAPYSPRARRGAPVAVPLSWKELKSPTRPLFTVSQFAEWAGRLKADPWRRMVGLKQSLLL